MIDSHCHLDHEQLKSDLSNIDKINKIDILFKKIEKNND